jgi:hypothetical protein
LYTVPESHPDIDGPRWDELELDSEVLALRWAEPDPKDEALRWIGNGAERAALVAAGVWYVVSDGWFGSSLGADIAGNAAGAVVLGGTCFAAGAVIKRRRPELFEDPAAAPATGGW